MSNNENPAQSLTAEHLRELDKVHKNVNPNIEIENKLKQEGSFMLEIMDRNPRVDQEKQINLMKDYEISEEVGSDYIIRDPIFSLKMPLTEDKFIKSKVCPGCNISFSSKKKFKTNCQFCGRGFCVDCIKRTKVFPSDVAKTRGNICKICCTKFFIKDLYDRYRDIFIQKDEEIMKVETELKNRQVDKSRIASELDQIKRKIAYDKKNHNDQMSKLEITLKTLTSEHETLQKENQSIMASYNDSLNTMRDLDSKIENLYKEIKENEEELQKENGLKEKTIKDNEKAIKQIQFIDHKIRQSISMSIQPKVMHESIVDESKFNNSSVLSVQIEKRCCLCC